VHQRLLIFNYIFLSPEPFLMYCWEYHSNHLMSEAWNLAGVAGVWWWCFPFRAFFWYVFFYIVVHKIMTPIIAMRMIIRNPSIQYSELQFAVFIVFSPEQCLYILRTSSIQYDHIWGILLYRLRIVWMWIHISGICIVSLQNNSF
jgi:hypothetical protein